MIVTNLVGGHQPRKANTFTANGSMELAKYLQPLIRGRTLFRNIINTGSMNGADILQILQLLPKNRKQERNRHPTETEMF
ncbi:MAG: hypothetical protein AVO38_10585 [delta proteobacterium ML8_D]|nr:MAG: hypothetical protein AVO38_10585 [delta proteobacterium ML8_D]